MDFVKEHDCLNLAVDRAVDLQDLDNGIGSIYMLGIFHYFVM